MTKLKVKVNSTSRRRLAGDMAMRNDLAFDNEIMTSIIRHTNPMSPLIFFSNVLGGKDNGSEDSMFSVQPQAIGSEFLRVDEIKTGIQRPLRVLDNSKVPDIIFANTPFDIEVDFPVDIDENLLLRDQKSMVTVRGVRVTTTTSLTLELQGMRGTSISKELLMINAPLNTGYGNSKGEGSPNSNTLPTTEANRNSFCNPLVITRYVFPVTGSYLSNDVYTLNATNEVGDESIFAIDLPVEFFRQVLSSIERMMLYSIGNFDINTLEILGRSRTSRYQERPSYLGIFQQLDDINEVYFHSLSSETPKQGLFKLDSALRYIKAMTGGDSVVAAVCSGVGAEFLRYILREEVQRGNSPIQFQQAVGPDQVIPVGFKVNQYISDHGTLMIYDMDQAMTSRRTGQQFDQITFNGVTSDERSRNIYFIPLNRMSRGKKVKRAKYFYKESSHEKFGKTSRAFVFGTSKGLTGQGNNITAEQAFNFQESAITQMMNSAGSKIDNTVDGNEYHVLTHGTPYINVDDAVRLILLK